MKTKKFLFTIAFLLALAIAAIAVFFNSGSSSTKVSDSSIYAEYISAYTSGIISKKSTITVKLTENTANQVKKENLDIDDLFDFNPSISGKANWVDNQTLEFKPDADLKGGTHYSVDFNLGKLIEISDELKTFTFEFFTIKQNFDVTVEETRTIDKSTYKLQKTSGIITLADYETIDNIQKLLSAKQDGNPVEVKISAAGENKFSFELDSINRTNVESLL